MGYWGTKVLPKIKKVFDINGKKAEAVEACKSFEGSKEEINKEFEEKKDELKPKVLEVYEASSDEIKTLVKERKESGLKKKSASINIFLEELVKIEFPGSKQVHEASTKYGPVLTSSSIFFIFEKVATFLPIEAPVETIEKEAPTTTEEITPATETPAVVEEKKEEIKKEVEETTKEVAPPPPVEAPAAKASEPEAATKA